MAWIDGKVFPYSASKFECSYFGLVRKLTYSSSCTCRVVLPPRVQTHVLNLSNVVQLEEGLSEQTQTEAILRPESEVTCWNSLNRRLCRTLGGFFSTSLDTKSQSLYIFIQGMTSSGTAIMTSVAFSLASQKPANSSVLSLQQTLMVSFL